MHELSESVDEVCHSSRELNNVQITQKNLSTNPPPSAEKPIVTNCADLRELRML